MTQIYTRSSESLALLRKNGGEDIGALAEDHTTPIETYSTAPPAKVALM